PRLHHLAVRRRLLRARGLRTVLLPSEDLGNLKPAPATTLVAGAFLCPDVDQVDGGRDVSRRDTRAHSIGGARVRMSTDIPSRDDPPARSGRGSGACNHPLHTSCSAPGSRPVLGVDGGESPLVPPDPNPRRDTPTRRIDRYLGTYVLPSIADSA